MRGVLMAYPDWVEKQRRKGTNISHKNGNFYLYEASSVWDKEKKRAKKITGKYLGKITPDGLVPPKKKIVPVEEVTNSDSTIVSSVNKKDLDETLVSVKSYGAYSIVRELTSDIYNKLEKYFPNSYKSIYTISLLRLIEKCPFKMISHAYSHNYISQELKGLALSGSSISNLIRTIGTNRETCVSFMEEFIEGSQYILFDGTNITTKSKELDINKIGYNAHRNYDPQINLLYAFSTDKNCPVYYRILPGNIREVSSFAMSIAEANLKNTLLIGDKGFGSNKNFELLEEYDLKYIIPLRRNNGLFDKEKLKSGSIDTFDGHFLYNKRAIFYYSYVKENKNIIVYQDRELRMREEVDYVTRMASNIENYTEDRLMEKQYDFGSFVVATNVDDTPENIYGLYKKRGEIEQNFDFLKNLLEIDSVYVQNNYAVEGWALINHISLMMVYKLYDILREKELVSKYSINELLSHLKYIQKVKINGEWKTSEINGKTKKLLKELELDIT